MKGLLIKDFRLAFINIRILCIVAAVIFLIVGCGDEDGIEFIVYFVTAMCMMMVITTISYDDSDNGLAFLLTLPVSRKTYVTEKYIFAFLGGYGGFFLSFAIAVLYSLEIGKAGITSDFLMESALVCAIYIYNIVFHDTGSPEIW